jgi:hypothetical protein
MTGVESMWVGAIFGPIFLVLEAILGLIKALF